MAAPAMEGLAVTALRSVILRVRQAAESSGRRCDQVRVIAVSKTKPVSLIREVYDAGHRVFGENYVQEIIDKAPQLPEDIEWHFIGHLQSNKVKSILAAVPNLAMVHGVDNVKIAGMIDMLYVDPTDRKSSGSCSFKHSKEAFEGFDPSKYQW